MRSPSLQTAKNKQAHTRIVAVIEMKALEPFSDSLVEAIDRVRYARMKRDCLTILSNILLKFLVY